MIYILKIAGWVLLLCWIIIAGAITAVVVSGAISACKGYKNVTRCKECKWHNDPGCAVYIVDDVDRPADDDFCSFAERREE